MCKAILSDLTFCKNKNARCFLIAYNYCDLHLSLLGTPEFEGVQTARENRKEILKAQYFMKESERLRASSANPSEA